MVRGWWIASLMIIATSVRAAEPMVMDLYPAETLAPVKLGDEKVDDRGKDGAHNRFIGNVTHPTLTLYQPAVKNSGAAVVICPGGGYGGVAIDKEGYDIAEWLNTLGVTGIVLKYRMPKPELSKAEKPWPLQDAQRAIETVREHATEWKIDAKKVGIMGFSAGGHLAATAGTHFEEGNRPDFMILIYPVITLKPPIGHVGSRNNLLGKEADEKLVELYSNDEQVTARTPPTFLVHAEDDPVKCENSLRFFSALRANKVPCEMQLFVKGGHGFGLAAGKEDAERWPARCAAWLRQMKILGSP